VNSFLQLHQFIFTNQICFIQQNNITKANLFLAFFALIQVQANVFGIYQSDDGIQFKLICQLFIHPECLRHRSRIRHTCSFNQNKIKTVFAL